MVEIYTTPSCASCRKAKKWFDQNSIEYTERNLFNIKLTGQDLRKILEKTENGFEDIISTRSKAFKDNDLEIDDMKMNDLINFIQDYPSVLRRPIIIDHKRLQVGYNDEEIRCFLPREMRQQWSCIGEGCASTDCECSYLDALKDALDMEKIIA